MRRGLLRDALAIGWRRCRVPLVRSPRLGRAIWWFQCAWRGRSLDVGLPSRRSCRRLVLFCSFFVQRRSQFLVLLLLLLLPLRNCGGGS